MGEGGTDTLFAISGNHLLFLNLSFCKFSLGPLLLSLKKSKGGGRLVICQPYLPPADQPATEIMIPSNCYKATIRMGMMMTLANDHLLLKGSLLIR